MSFLRRLVDALLSPASRTVATSTPGSLTEWTPESATAPSEPTRDYAPERDGEPDPGEVVWAWVAYEEDPTQGKDRPVLLIGRAGDELLGLQLTSKDHDRDHADEARWGRYWMDVGSGGWDREGRPSEVRLDRLLHLAPEGVRREGAALDRDLFDRVLAEAARFHDFLR